MQNPYRKLRNYEVVYDKQLPHDTVAMQLAELATKHAHSVPFRVQVVTNCMVGSENGPKVALDEIYTVHLVRETRVLVAQQSSGKKLEVPTSSSVKVGLVPEDDVTRYRTVGDILGAKQLPKVITVRHQFLSSDKKISLRKNDVLLVKEAVKGILGCNKTALRVFNLFSHQELVLTRDCDAEFITDPECTQCYISDLLDNDITFIPCSVHFYPSQGAVVTPPSTTFTLCRQETRHSMIVSCFQQDPNTNPQHTKFIDIPTSADISVTILPTDQSGRIYDRIYEESQLLLTNYSPSQIQYCVNTAKWHISQATMLAEVREGRAAREMVRSAPQQYHKFLASGQGLQVKAQPILPPKKKVNSACEE